MTTDHELPEPARGFSRFRRRRHRLAGVAAGLVVVGVAAASGTAAHSPAALATSRIAAKVDPGLVDINSTLGYEHAASAGTGLVLTPAGEVLTNNHVVEGATSIKVTDVGNGRAYQAVVVGYDRTRDVAVLRIQHASGLATVTLGDSASVAAGQRVVALGNAGGRGGKPSVATGRVVSLGESITASDAAAGTSEQLSGLIHTDAPIRPGDSGGPLVNTAGRVIAINTAASSGPQFRFHTSGPTQAYAIPIAQAKSIARRIEDGRASRTVHLGATAFLGVQVLSAGAGGAAAGPGATVAGVLPSSPAGRAGLSPGDVIHRVAGRAITSPSRLQSVLGRYHPGDRVTVGWTDQSGLRHTATVTLAKGPVG
jgi:S1-C subfamily serine protease